MQQPAGTIGRDARFVRFGDNMRYVAVTEGDKVEAEMKFGYSVNTHGVGDLVKVINEVTDDAIDMFTTNMQRKYKLASTLVKGKNNTRHCVKLQKLN